MECVNFGFLGSGGAVSGSVAAGTEWVGVGVTVGEGEGVDVGVGVEV